MRHALILLLLFGCTASSTPSATPTVPTTPEPAQEVRKQLCIYGAFTYTDGANPWFSEICRTFDNRINNPADGMPGFRIFEIDAAVETLIEELDDNGDGRVTDEDRTVVDVLGYSWGGVLASQLDLHAEEDVDTSRTLIGRVVLIDPFAPPAGEALEIPGQIERLWMYGHSVSPPWDCSTGAPLAPYRSRPIDCSTTDAPCTQYDLSLDREVGHCSIIQEVEDWVLANMAGSDPAPADLQVVFP